MFAAAVLGVETINGERTTVVIRVHLGSVHVGDQIQRAKRPDGSSMDTNLRVSGLWMARTSPVDLLETNYGGAASLTGVVPAGLADGWTLYSD